VTDLKKLAEFAAKFLGHKRDYDHWNYKLMGHNWKPHKDFLAEFTFSDPRTAPLIAHLAKREMEKRGFEMEWSSRGEENLHYYYIYKKGGLMHHSMGEHENEYIALWSAIMETGEK